MKTVPREIVPVPAERRPGVERNQGQRRGERPAANDVVAVSAVQRVVPHTAGDLIVAVQAVDLGVDRHAVDRQHVVPVAAVHGDQADARAAVGGHGAVVVHGQGRAGLGDAEVVVVIVALDEERAPGQGDRHELP
jgi:hypothetical protein